MTAQNEEKMRGTSLIGRLILRATMTESSKVIEELNSIVGMQHTKLVANHQTISSLMEQLAATELVVEQMRVRAQDHMASELRAKCQCPAISNGERCESQEGDCELCHQSAKGEQDV